MNTLYVTTSGDSPRGRQQYMSLHSPTGVSSRPTLPFLVLAFLSGVLLSGTWNKLRLPTSRKNSFKFPRIAADETAGSLLRSPNATGSLPIAWLMSFPNSGTSYTSYLVRKVTGKNTASNSGTESFGKDGTSVGVFGDHAGAGGPFWTEPLKRPRTESGYLLTKTHCGGRCNRCSLHQYVEMQHTFSRRCFEGHRVSKDENGAPTSTLVSYSKEHVQRAVHLIRDPFDNVVSRFHLTIKHFVERNQTEAARYPKSKAGFLTFCRDQGRRYRRDEQESRFYEDVFDEARNVPCHADFFRYIQWHNLAFTTTWNLRIPTMILHYENYTYDLGQTQQALLDFLEQEGVHEPPLFINGKTYREYFTEAEIQAVSAMFSTLAMAKTLEHTKHYFMQ